MHEGSAVETDKIQEYRTRKFNYHYIDNVQFPENLLVCYAVRTM